MAGCVSRFGCWTDSCAPVGEYTVVESPGVHGSGEAPGKHNQVVLAEAADAPAANTTTAVIRAGRSREIERTGRNLSLCHASTLDAPGPPEALTIGAVPEMLQTPTSASNDRRRKRGRAGARDPP